MTYPPHPPHQSPVVQAGQPPRRRVGRTVLIVVAIVLVVCCGGAAATGYFVFRGVSEASGPPREATRAFFTDVVAGRYAAAFDRLCPETQQRYPVERLEEVLSVRRPTGHRLLSGFSYNNSNGVQTSRVPVTLTYADGDEERSIPLRKVGNVWKVCGSPY